MHVAIGSDHAAFDDGGSMTAAVIDVPASGSTPLR